MRRLPLLLLPLALAAATAALGQLTGSAKAPTRTETSASGPGDDVQVTISHQAFGTQTLGGGAIHKTAIQSSEYQGRLYDEIANDVESGPDEHSSMMTRPVAQVPGSSGTMVHTVKEMDLEGLDAPSNDVAVSAESSDSTRRDYYQHIQPTRAQEASGEALQALSSTAEPRSQPGEGPGAPRGRSLPLPEPRHQPRQASAAAPPAASGDQRKTNPDIQDIITGIVKLLNGNVKVQVGGAPSAPLVSRPGRPTRINNRGPPRITDVPLPLPPPSMMPPPPPPTRGQHPYPFHRPHLSHQGNGSVPMVSPPYVTGVPLPEQIVPVTSAITSWGMRPPPPDHTSVWPDMEPPKDQIYSTDFSDSYGDSELSHSPPVTVMTTATFTTPVKEITDIPSKNDSVDAVGAETDSGNVLHDHKSGGSQKNEKETVQTELALPTNNSLGPSDTSSQHEPNPTSATDNSEKPPQHTTPAVETLNETTSTSVSVKTTTPKIIVDKVSTSKAAPTKSTTMKPTTSKQSTPKATSPKTATTEKITVPRRTSVTTPETTTTISPTEALGIGVAEPVLESSMHEWPVHQIHTAKLPDSATSFHTASQSTGADLTYNVYRPRPGIVLDDTEYKPTKPTHAAGEIFDVTVTAIQGPGGSVNSDGRPHRHPGSENGDVSVITMPQEGQHFVSIDGKRTYINLFGSTTDSHSVAPSRVHQFPGFAIPEDKPTTPSHQVPSRRPFTRRPTQTPVRIDTCIVGDDSTCDAAQNEICRTELGVSSCHCRPGFSRRKHREPCRRIVSMVLSLRVDRMYDKRVTWNDDLRDKNSDEYQQLQWEASQAINSAMSMTPFSDDVMGVNVNGIYTVGGYGPVFANVTLQLEETAETLRPAVRHDIRRHLLGAIQRRGNNVGASALWVDSLPGAVTDVLDLDECSHPALHDCHSLAECSNVFGTFRCVCPAGLRDPWAGDVHHSGRKCEACPQQHCSGHGECRFEGNQQVCHCTGNFYGSQCEIDGEVLGVAVGASLAALVIIVLTLVFLCMWSRRWSKEQKTVTGVGSPVFDYMGAAGSAVKTPSVGAPPYQVTLEERLRWAQIAGAMAQANHYTQLDTMNAPTRPSSTVFGYPNLAPSIQQCQNSAASRAMSLKGTHTADSSSSEEEDQVDLLGRNFHVPRPKSRSSIANQSGIYYDVEYEPEDIYSTKHPPTSIPLSTYRMGHLPYYQK